MANEAVLSRLAYTSVKAVEFFRQWPIIPGSILLLLLICGIFAPLIAPEDPVAATLRARNYAARVVG